MNHRAWRRGVVQRLCRVSVRSAGITLAVMAFVSNPAYADQPAAPKASREPWRQTWGGAQVVGSDWSVYSGTTVAPSGSISQPGWRLRATGGYGEYRYHGVNRLGPTPTLQRFKGRSAFSDLLAGYQWQAGDWTIKAFAGASIIGHVISPRDLDNPVSGTHFGATAVVETWFNISRETWLSNSVSWSSVFRTYKADMRLGTRLTDNLDIGLEAAVTGDQMHDNGRAGGFIQFHVGETEIRASSGVSGDRDGNTDVYGTLNLLFTF